MNPNRNTFSKVGDRMLCSSTVIYWRRLLPKLLNAGRFLGAANNPMQEMTIEEALREHTDRLMSLLGVVGTGQGLCDGQPCIKIFITKKTPVLLRQIPAEIEGYAVAVEETGEIRARKP